eukprot:6490726-Amphidinium_carterae.3
MDGQEAQVARTAPVMLLSIAEMCTCGRISPAEVLTSVRIRNIVASLSPSQVALGCERQGRRDGLAKGTHGSSSVRHGLGKLRNGHQVRVGLDWGWGDGCCVAWWVSVSLPAARRAAGLWAAWNDGRNQRDLVILRAAKAQLSKLLLVSRKRGAQRGVKHEGCGLAAGSNRVRAGGVEDDRPVAEDGHGHRRALVELVVVLRNAGVPEDSKGIPTKRGRCPGLDPVVQLLDKASVLGCRYQKPVLARSPVSKVFLSSVGKDITDLGCPKSPTGQRDPWQGKSGSPRTS